MLWEIHRPLPVRMARGNDSSNSVMATWTDERREPKSRFTPALNASHTLSPAFMIPSPWIWARSWLAKRKWTCEEKSHLSAAARTSICQLSSARFSSKWSPWMISCSTTCRCGLLAQVGGGDELLEVPPVVVQVAGDPDLAVGRQVDHLAGRSELTWFSSVAVSSVSMTWSISSELSGMRVSRNSPTRITSIRIRREAAAGKYGMATATSAKNAKGAAKGTAKEIHRFVKIAKISKKAQTPGEIPV